MQELFLRLIEIKRPEKIGNLEAYACRIAINLAFERRRRRHIFIEIPQNRPDLRIPNVDLRLIQAEEIQAILNAAGDLSGQMQECFVLHYIEQMDYPEIAKRLHKNQSQVRALCSKAIQRIRLILKEQNAAFYKEAINE